jgi:hypothetical protein
LLLFDDLILFPDAFIFLVIIEPAEYDKYLEDLLADNYLMADIEYIFLECLEVTKFKISVLTKSFELVEFINQPPHDENEALNFPDELIGEVDLVDLGFQGTTIGVLFH